MIGTGLHSHPQPAATGERILLPAALKPRSLRQQRSELLVEMRRRKGAASRRAAAGCALSPEHLDQQLAPLLPQTPRLQRSWQQDPLADGLWLRVAVEAGADQPRLQRRLLLTAAGLGLCSPVQP